MKTDKFTLVQSVPDKFLKNDFLFFLKLLFTSGNLVQQRILINFKSSFLFFNLYTLSTLSLIICDVTASQVTFVSAG